MRLVQLTIRIQNEHAWKKRNIQYTWVDFAPRYGNRLLYLPEMSKILGDTKKIIHPREVFKRFADNFHTDHSFGIKKIVYSKDKLYVYFHKNCNPLYRDILLMYADGINRVIKKNYEFVL